MTGEPGPSEQIVRVPDQKSLPQEQQKEKSLGGKANHLLSKISLWARSKNPGPRAILKEIANTSDKESAVEELGSGGADASSTEQVRDIKQSVGNAASVKEDNEENQGIDEMAKAIQEEVTVHPSASESSGEYIPRKRFERISVANGQLSIEMEAAKQLSENFVATLISEAPWDNVEKGKWLQQETKRRVQLYDIGGYPIVLKEMHTAGEKIAALNKRVRLPNLVRETSPSAQVAIVEEAKRRYREMFHEDLPIEEVVGFYIDKQSTRKYMLYKYYPPFGDDSIDINEIHTRYQQAKKEVTELNQRLWDVGIDRHERLSNFVMTPDPSSERGWKIVLIDTEYWRNIKRDND